MGRTSGLSSKAHALPSRAQSPPAQLPSANRRVAVVAESRGHDGVFEVVRRGVRQTGAVLELGFQRLEGRGIRAALELREEGWFPSLDVVLHDLLQDGDSDPEEQVLRGRPQQTLERDLDE